MLDLKAPAISQMDPEWMKRLRLVQGANLLDCHRRILVADVDLLKSGIVIGDRVATMRRLMAKRFPIILSTWTFGQIANAAGWPVLAKNGKSIDAVEEACIAVESDPEVDSVGI